MEGGLEEQLELFPLDNNQAARLGISIYSLDDNQDARQVDGRGAVVQLGGETLASASSHLDDCQEEGCTQSGRSLLLDSLFNFEQRASYTNTFVCVLLCYLNAKC